MPLKLIVNPNINEMSWNEFVATKPPYSIALDGYIADSPRFDPGGPYLNLNHHEGVPRLETRSSSAQVRVHVQQGLFDRFRNSRNSHALVWVNDCDQDVCFAWTIISNPDVLSSTEFLRLLDIVDMRDTCGGFCPPPLRPEDGDALAWIFEPYQTFRFSGRITKRRSREFRQVIEDVRNRILAHLNGHGEQRPVRMDYSTILTGSNWIMVDENTTDSRMKIHADGHRAFVSAKQRVDGNWQYSIGKSSPLIQFPILQILDELGKAEPNSRYTWGGSELIAGCNRVHGSSLSPNKVATLIEQILRPEPVISQGETVKKGRFHDIVWSQLSPKLSPHEIRRAVQLASVLEPLSEKVGCTGRLNNVTPEQKLEFFIGAGINIGDAFEELAKRLLTRDLWATVYDLAYRAQVDSKKNRRGGRTNQGIIEFLFPLVISQCNILRGVPVTPEEVIRSVPAALKKTTEHDVSWLQKMQNLAFEMSGYYHRLFSPVRFVNISAYYEHRLAASERPSDFYHNREIVEDFPTLRRMLTLFRQGELATLSENVEQVFREAREQEPQMPSGMLADLVVCSLYLLLTHQRTTKLIR